MALCVTGTADVVLVNSTVSFNLASGILAADHSQVVLRDRSIVGSNIVVRDNPYQDPTPGSAVLAVGVSAIGSARVFITGGSIVGANSANAYVAHYEGYRDPCDPIVGAYENVDYGGANQGREMGPQGCW